MGLLGRRNRRRRRRRRFVAVERGLLDEDGVERLRREWIVASVEARGERIVGGGGVLDGEEVEDGADVVVSVLGSGLRLVGGLAAVVVVVFEGVETGVGGAEESRR